jgi:hypothetical protein
MVNGGLQQCIGLKIQIMTVIKSRGNVIKLGESQWESVTCMFGSSRN